MATNFDTFQQRRQTILGKGSSSTGSMPQSKSQVFQQRRQQILSTYNTQKQQIKSKPVSQQVVKVTPDKKGFLDEIIRAGSLFADASKDVLSSYKVGGGITTRQLLQNQENQKKKDLKTVAGNVADLLLPETTVQKATKIIQSKDKVKALFDELDPRKYLNNALDVARSIDEKKTNEVIKSVRSESQKLIDTGSKELTDNRQKRIEKFGQRQGVGGFIDQVITSAPSSASSIGISVASGYITRNPRLALALGFANSYVQGASEIYQEAKQSGVGEDKAQELASTGAILIGAVDILPINNLLSKLPAGKFLEKNIQSNIIKTLAETGSQALYEGGTEGVQQVIQNAIAQTYNEHKDLFEGVSESVVMGSVLGAGSDVIVNAVNKSFEKLSGGKSPQQQRESVDQKVKEAFNTPEEKRTKEQQRIVKSFTEKEVNPSQVISIVANNPKLANTPDGNEIIKISQQALEQGKNVVIDFSNDQEITARIADQEDVNQVVSSIKTDNEKKVKTFESNIQDYRSFGGRTDGTSVENASLRDIADVADDPTIVSYTQDKVQQAIDNKELSVDKDGFITVYRGGKPSSKNKMMSVSYDKEVAQSFVKEGEEVKTLKIKPEDIKAFIGKAEKELLLKNPNVEKETTQEVPKNDAGNAGLSDTLYHGTTREFDNFDLNQAGTRNPADQGFAGRGVYFSNSKEVAETFANNKDIFKSVTSSPGKGRIIEAKLDPSARVLEVNNFKEMFDKLGDLGIERKDPFYLKGDAKIQYKNQLAEAVRKKAQELGYDAIKVDGGGVDKYGTSTYELVVFDPKHINQTPRVSQPSLSDEKKTERTFDKNGKETTTQQKRPAYNAKESQAVQDSFTNELNRISANASTQEDTIQKVKTLLDQTIDKLKYDRRGLSGIRTALNKEMFGLSGSTGNYKADYAQLQQMFNDPDLGDYLQFLQERIIDLDKRILTTPEAPPPFIANPPKTPSEKRETTPSKEEPVGTGKVKNSKFVERIKEQLKDIYDIENVTYNELNLTKQAEMVESMIEEDPKRAMRIAKGFEEPVPGTTQNGFALGLAELALKNNDIDTARSLWNRISLRSTRAGEEIVTLRGHMNNTDPLNHIRRVMVARLDKLADKYKGAIEELNLKETATKTAKAKEYVKHQVKKAKKELTEQQQRIQSAQEILNALTCK